MGSARSLQPQDQIAHYLIVGPLGTGGMGEVYLAQDQTLERSVALKILPPELVQSEERVRRFVREAKSASSLNHPNIVTIYEIGQSEVRSPVSAAAKGPGSSSVHYMSMELVTGATLTTKIHQEKTNLRTLLGYLAQAAEGLAKAHAAGIVHRDLKPGNIMVSKDGYAKILDFGLAKLTEKGVTDTDATGGLTQTGDETRAGTAVGTVGYMSPEQVRGNPVDHRSDIFSFGCILYEAATRTKPFAGESSVETMHKILHDMPVPIDELNKEAPAELRRLIRRCLAKNPDARLQSAKDLAIELREIVDEYDALSSSGSSGSGSSALAAPVPRRRRVSPIAVGAGAVVAVVIIVVGILLFRRETDSETRASAKSLQISAITNRGFLTGLALSPDGRFLAYGLLLEGQRSLRVRQLATGSDVQILPPPQVRPANSLMFSPDGNYLYYIMADPEHDNYSALFEIPTLGGAPRRRVYDVDTRVTFSPDGKRICFYRGVPDKNLNLLMIADLESRREQVLATVTSPSYFGDPAWSPDGKRIAVMESRLGLALGQSLVTYRVDNGRREQIGTKLWARGGIGLGDIAWLPDGKAMLISASDQPMLPNPQLWQVTYPQGRAIRLTRDANSYSTISVSSDGKTVAVNRSQAEANLWTVSPTSLRDVRQITFSSADEGAIRTFDLTDDSTIIFETIRNASAQLYSVREDGSGERLLTEGQKLAVNPSFRPGRGIFYLHADEDLLPHIWRADANGENARALTSGLGERIEDVSPDGRAVLFRRDDVTSTLWKVSSDGGAPVRIGRSLSDPAGFSPDGAKIFYTIGFPESGRGGMVRHIVPADGGDVIAKPEFPPGSFGIVWAPGGNAMTYLNNSNLLRNLFRLRLDGSSPQEITHFTGGRIFTHKYSPDGKRLLLRRELGNAVNLWIAGADGSNPVALTEFETGFVQDMKWARDGTHVIFTYGAVGDNAILIRNFR